jgi:RNA polymerase sigma-70 factor, ECF subfamily
VVAPPDLVEFCRTEHGRLVGSLSLYTGDQLLAEEIAQEALVRVCEQWSRVRTMSAPGAWAHRVAMNLAKSRFRRRAIERRLDPRAGTVDRVMEEDTAQALAVRDAIARLPARQREAIVLRHVAGLSVEEAATAMNVTPGALRSLTHRATGQLQAWLETRDDEVDCVC